MSPFAVRATVVVLAAAVALSGCGATSTPASQPRHTDAAATARAATAPAGGGTAAGRGAPVPGRTSYVAMGDSYSAAPGVPDTEVAGGCLRSDHDYPHLLAAAVPTLSLNDVTCTGATTADLTSSQHIGQSVVPPQLDALTSTTQLVTLSIGGNDLGLSQPAVERCLHSHPDCVTGSDVSRNLPVIGGRLEALLQQIHRRSPAARIFLVSYPQIVPRGRVGCAALPADAAVLAWMRGLMADFASTMHRAATSGDATYVDLLGPSAGHDICSSAPWINGVQQTDRAFALHPFLAEQQAVARLLEERLS